MLFKMFPPRFIQLMVRLGEDGEGLSLFRDMSGIDLTCAVLELQLTYSSGWGCPGPGLQLFCPICWSTGSTRMVIAAIAQNLGCYDAVAGIRMVKSTYVETKNQEMLLKNKPEAIDKMIVLEKPHLARAIAAEHLIQVFITHKDKIE